MNELYFFIGGFILIFIFGNLTLHLYYKRKHEKFLAFLKGKDFVIIKNAKIDIDISGGRTSYNYHKNIADVVFFKNHIFLLATSKFLKQAQPILQLSRIGNNEKFSEIWEEIQYISKMKVENKLRITGFSMRGSLRINYKIFVNLENKDFCIQDW